MLKNFASASWTSGNVLISERVLLLKEDSVTPGATVLLQLCIMTLPFNRLTAYNICRDCFQCFLTLSQSHAAVVKRYNAFCLKLTANSDTEQTNISKSTFPVCVNEHFHI